MRTNRFRRRPKLRSESGQVLLFVLLGLGLFLIGAMAFAVDLSNAWFNRQAAQTAADAACTAGAMDLLVDATNGVTNQGQFNGGSGASSFDCHSTTPNNSSSDPAPCVYAALNGFSSSVANGSTALGDNVSVSFPSPSSYPNFNFPSSAVAPTVLMQVTVTNNVPTFFAGMLRGLTKQNVGATSVCGVVQANSQIPILVLNPTVATSFNTQGTPNISIIGGPSKSIEVNSNSLGNAVNIGGSASVNLCAAGTTYCGGGMGVWGSQSAPSGFITSCGGNRPPGAPACSGSQQIPQWNSPSAPIADPFALISAPQVPTHHTWANNGRLNPNVPPQQKGCPLPVGSGGHCVEYAPGFYPDGIQVLGETAIFDPGLYYLDSHQPGCNGKSLCVDSNSCLRPSDRVGDGSGGVIFYFSDGNSIGVKGNGGGCNNGELQFDTTAGALGLGVKCTASSQSPSTLPGLLGGSVLLAPCQAPISSSGWCAPNCGLNYGDPQGTSNPLGEQRGILFFQNRAVNAGSNPNWIGGGGLLVAGTMYFHQCVTSGTDTGVGCNFGSAFNDVLSFGGNSGATTYVLGDIVVDQLSLQGTSSISMYLNSSSAYSTLKATLLR